MPLAVVHCLLSISAVSPPHQSKQASDRYEPCEQCGTKGSALHKKSSQRARQSGWAGSAHTLLLLLPLYTALKIVNYKLK
jgi:hypothetical protein